MPERMVPVVFTGTTASIVSQSRHSRGQVLRFFMPHRIRVGTNRPVEFQPPRIEIMSARGTSPLDKQYEWPELAAGHLEQFVQHCFAGRHRPEQYTSFNFVSFLSGLTREPTADLPRGRTYASTGNRIPAQLIRPAWGYIIMSGAESRLGMVGLAPNLVVGVFGKNSAFGISEALPLVQLYGGDGIAEVHGLV